jgi:hypothetical protein
VSVDTYLKGKDLSPYQRLEIDDVELHVSPALSTWADRASVTVRSGALGKRFEILADHKHQPT